VIFKRKHEPDESTIFSQLEHIFKEHRAGMTPIDAFLQPLGKRDRHNQPRPEPLKITFGNVNPLSITVKPTDTLRFFRGRDLTAAFITIYNDDYWLIALWDHFADAARGSSVAREIVRAFVKHCIYVTAEEIAQQTNEMDASRASKYGRINHVMYFKQVFDWSQIWKCIRAPTKRKLSERVRKKKRTANAIDYRLVKASVPQLEAMFQELDLPKVVFWLTSQPSQMGGVIKFLTRFYASTRDRGRLKKAIKSLVKKDEQ
jgi:hypothetical protein